jgi:hypothetical protein
MSKVASPDLEHALRVNETIMEELAEVARQYLDAVQRYRESEDEAARLDLIAAEIVTHALLFHAKGKVAHEAMIEVLERAPEG